MPTPPALIPPDIEQCRLQRDAIWQEFDSSLAQSRELETLAGHLAATAAQPAALPSALANPDNPAAEIAAAVRALQGTLESIQRTKGQILGHQSEIERIKAQRIKFAIAAVVAIVILLLVML